MQVALPYDQSTISIEIEEHQLGGILEPKTSSGNSSAGDLLFEALEHPFGERFEHFLERPGPLAVIVNDATRPTPTGRILTYLAENLAREHCEFIVASGAHREVSEEHLRYVFGEYFRTAEGSIHVHNAFRRSEMVRLGTTDLGSPVEINRRVVEAGKILVIGSVEPHYFAGYTGGRKGLFPGAASYHFIEQNHRHALSPQSAALQLAGNPVHEDLDQALGFVDMPIYSLMAVLDRHQELYAVTAGDIREAFMSAASYADEVYSVPVAQKADVVLACAAHPMDRDFYQAHKAIEHGKLALKKGGTLILAAACRDGIGEKNFADLLQSACSPEEVLRRVRENYRLGYHKAGNIAELLQWAEIQMFTYIGRESLEQMYIKRAEDLQKAVDDALGKGRDRRIICIPDGTVTVPRVTS